jgi:hypothetical protein
VGKIKKVSDPLVPVVLDYDEDYDQYLARLPEAKRARIFKANNRMKTGLHTIAPLTCVGPAKCKFLPHCPIPDKNTKGEIIAGPAENYPIGRPCIMEAMYMKSKVEDYYTHLQVDTTNPVEISLVNELAVLDLYKNRALMVLSSGDADGHGQDLLKVDITGVTEQGLMLKSTQTHPAFNAMDQIENRRAKLLDKLLETRKAQADLQAKMGVKQESSKVLEELQAVRKLLLGSGNDDGGSDPESGGGILTLD